MADTIATVAVAGDGRVEVDANGNMSARSTTGGSTSFGMYTRK